MAGGSAQAGRLKAGRRRRVSAGGSAQAGQRRQISTDRSAQINQHKQMLAWLLTLKKINYNKLIIKFN